MQPRPADPGTPPEPGAAAGAPDIAQVSGNRGDSRHGDARPPQPAPPTTGNTAAGGKREAQDYARDADAQIDA